MGKQMSKNIHPNSGGSYRPGLVMTYGEDGRVISIPAPGTSLRTEVALRIFHDMVACRLQEEERGDVTVREEADALALGAFIFADAFIRASKRPPANPPAPTPEFEP
jgi:hypothetical protein